jgi:hypothetical protein
VAARCSAPFLSDSDSSGLTFAVRLFGRSAMRQHEFEPGEAICMALLGRSDLRARECPSCGRRVYLNRDGCYRRHFAVEPDGRRHLCAASRMPVGIRPPALRRLDL